MRTLHTKAREQFEALVDAKLRAQAERWDRKAAAARDEGDNERALHFARLAKAARSVVTDSEGCPDCEGRGCADCTGVEAE